MEPLVVKKKKKKFKKKRFPGVSLAPHHVGPGEPSFKGSIIRKDKRKKTQKDAGRSYVHVAEMAKALELAATGSDALTNDAHGVVVAVHEQRTHSMGQRPPFPVQRPPNPDQKQRQPMDLSVALLPPSPEDVFAAHIG